MNANPAPDVPAASPATRRHREPLTASQHILHLLLTVFTGGLWAPVWIIRAVAGNVTDAPGPPAPLVPSSMYDPRFRTRGARP